MLKLEAGKRYVRRDGEITSPLEKISNLDYPFMDRAVFESYTEQGFYWKDGTEDENDLISVYEEKEATLEERVKLLEERIQSLENWRNS